MPSRLLRPSTGLTLGAALSAALLLAVAAAPVPARADGASSPAAQAGVVAVDVPLHAALPPLTQGYLAAALAAGAALCGVLGARARLARARLDARLETFVTPPAAAAPAIDLRGFQTRAITPLAEWLARVIDSLLPDRQVDRIRANLAIAGMPTRRHLSYFLAAKGGLAIGLPLLTTFLFLPTDAPLVRVILFGAFAAVLGFYLPGIWLGRRMNRRRQMILRALPDALDLLSISVSAGLGFDGAVIEVVQRWNNPLTEEFSTVLRDLKLGKSRRDALRDFAQRSGVDEVTSFVAAIIQADELGTAIKDVLLIQAEQIRQQRRYRAEERARKAVIKMLIPMVLFIFPAMFIVLMGPVVPSLRKLMGLSL